ncbi:MAG: type II toxin-antitoxin system VapC family toxin [Methylobacteriaceae bacterium]|nr:type II toxin-antitoxin system VapC family toxin [Methylobacteriaceae bacterium]
MIFADASALIAIVAKEPEGNTFTDIPERDARPLCPAISVWETVAGMTKNYKLPTSAARVRVSLFLEALNFKFVDIGAREFEMATDAFARFGKRRHPAALNMGDCFAYACARANDAKLLFKGNDFKKTDIVPAF